MKGNIIVIASASVQVHSSLHTLETALFDQRIIRPHISSMMHTFRQNGGDRDGLKCLQQEIMEEEEKTSCETSISKTNSFVERVQ